MALSVVVIGCSAVYLAHYGHGQKRSNIVVITLDALRADHLGCYGYAHNTSPNIDRLAREGVMFDKAISQTNWTGGSLVSLLTSTYPSTHRIESWGTVLNKRLITIAEALKNKKYVTACRVGGDWFKEFPGVERGFDHLFVTPDANELFKQAAGWIQKNKNNNFFIWLHLFDQPHAPYNPPPPFNQMFITNQPSRNLPIGKETEYVLSINVIPSWVAVNNITDINYYISQYDGEIAFADSLIGKLLDALKKEQVDKNTIIIISADHGESLGERGVYFQHGDCLYNQEIRVPLIIRGKNIPQGEVFNHAVQLVDIMPSIADMLGIKLGVKVEGRSFFPFNANKNHVSAFSEAGITRGIDGVAVNIQARSVIDGDWKLIYEESELKDSYELYNLRIDPGETVNLVETEEERFQALKTELERWMKRPRPAITAEKLSLDERTKKRLKSLGYLQ